MLLKTWCSRVTWVLCDKHATDTHLYNIFWKPRCPALLVLISKWEDIMAQPICIFCLCILSESCTIRVLVFGCLQYIYYRLVRLTCDALLNEGHNSVRSVYSRMKCAKFTVPHSWTDISWKCGSDCFLLQHLFRRDNQHMRFRSIYKLNSSSVHRSSFYLYWIILVTLLYFVFCRAIIFTVDLVISSPQNRLCPYYQIFLK